MESHLKLLVDEDGDQERLDKYLAAMLPEQSRTYIQKLIADGQIAVNGHPSKSHYKVRTGDEVTVDLPEPIRLDVEPEEIPLAIIYEDSSIIVVNKPPGMVVHPAAGNYAHTLVNALLYHTKDLSDINGVLRPGIVHRLDKDTSGCIIVAKSNDAHRKLSQQFEHREIKKEYVTIVRGFVRESHGIIDAGIARHPVLRKKMAVSESGRDALTRFEVIERFKNATLLRIKPETGRTHQIRVHLSHLGYPILGDDQYARPHRHHFEFPIPRQMLHAMTLGVTHPQTGAFIEFTAPLPEDMELAIDELRRERTS
ncbi:MAG TPA: RluA family pseudouridine synthase [bacterium]|nr:RluA family pseudouridine synthase [bacterium]